MRSRFEKRTYRELAALYGVAVCGGAKGCEHGVSYFAHRRGRADVEHGIIHDNRARRYVRRDGLASFLANVGLVLLYQQHGTQPRWRAIYEANIWAYREAKRTWHTTLTVRQTARARAQVLRLARFSRIRLRFRHPAIYAWATAPLEVVNHHGSQAPGPGGLDPGPPEDLRGDGRITDRDISG